MLDIIYKYKYNICVLCTSSNSFLQTPSASQFTEGASIRDYDETTGFVYSNAYGALDALEKWLEENQKELPYCDHAALLTA